MRNFFQRTLFQHGDLQTAQSQGCWISVALLLAMLPLPIVVSCAPSALPAGHTQANAASPVTEEASPTQEKESLLESPAESRSELPEPSPEPLYAEVPDDGKLMGPGGGIALESMSPSAHWVAYCTAKDPDADVPTTTRGEPLAELSLFLHIADRSEPIDALLAEDPSGRYVVVEKSGVAWLIDAVEDRRVDLSALHPDMRRDSLPQHRSFAFLDFGLAILQTPERGVLVHLPLLDVQPLENARTIDLGRRPTWRLQAAGAHLVAVTLDPETTPRSWPVPPAETPVRRCRGSHSPYSAFSKLSAYHPPDDVEYAWAKLSEATAAKKESLPHAVRLEPAPGFVMPFQNGWVRRQDTGRLLLVEGATQKQIASARCGARILHADTSTGLFLISCEDYEPVVEKPSRSKKKSSTPKFRFDLYLVRPGYVKSLHADVARTGVDVVGRQDQRFVPLRPGAFAALVDFSQRELVKFSQSTFVLATGQKDALLRTETGLSHWTPEGQRPLSQQISGSTPIVVAPKAVVVSDRLFLLGEELLEKKLPHTPLHVSELGYSLIPRKSGTTQSWPRGPLLLLPPPSSKREQDTPAFAEKKKGKE